MVKCDLAEFELTGLKTDKKENLHYILSLWSWREVDLLTESTTSINGTLKREEQSIKREMAFERTKINKKPFQYLFNSKQCNLKFSHT